MMPALEEGLNMVEGILRQDKPAANPNLPSSYKVTWGSYPFDFS